MKLMTKEIENRFKAVGSQENNSDPLVITKFFNPVGAATWWAMEYDPKERLFFGFVSLNGGRDYDAELGYFSLDELEGLRLPLGMRIERDLYWTERPMSRAKEIAVAKGEVAI